MKNLYLMLGLCFLAKFSTAQTNIFPASGNAGIGTTSPAASLDIYRSINFSQSRALKMFYYGTWGTIEYANAFRFIDIESTEGGKVLQVSGYGVGMGYDPPGISSPDKLYVNGRVGIGTSSPMSNLQVQKTSSAPALMIGGALPGTPRLQIYSLIEDADAWMGLGTNMSGATFEHSVYFSTGPAGSPGRLTFGDYNGTTYNTRMTILQNGNIGVGTTNPADKFAVNGNIRAKEIKVEATNWPDYVFDETYKLPSLSETEKHIKEKGHLPGIPSAAEVAANGVELGEMNKKLLEKIEELTLHLIDQGKEIKQLKDELKTLKKN